MQPPRIETARLILDAHRRDDFEPLAEMWTDPEVVRHISGKPSTRQESWSRLLRYRGLWPILGYGYWALREKQTNRYVGEVGFADFQRVTEPPLQSHPEAGWILARWAHGQGYATEALAGAISWLAQTGNFARTYCLVTDENKASIKVAEKNGFHLTGIVRTSAGPANVMMRDL